MFFSIGSYSESVKFPGLTGSVNHYSITDINVSALRMNEDEHARAAHLGPNVLLVLVLVFDGKRSLPVPVERARARSTKRLMWRARMTCEAQCNACN
jgi:hypothetical protein